MDNRWIRVYAVEMKTFEVSFESEDEGASFSLHFNRDKIGWLPFKEGFQDGQVQGKDRNALHGGED